MTTKLSLQKMRDLSDKVDGLIQLELGHVLPHVSLIATFDGELAVFTNRKSNDEVKAMLETALEALQRNAGGFIPY